MWLLPITLVRTLQLRVRESILPDQQGVGNLPELLTALPRASLYQPSPAALWQEQRPEREGRLELLSFCWPISVLKSKMPLDHLNPWPFLIKKKNRPARLELHQGGDGSSSSCCFPLPPRAREKQPLTDSRALPQQQNALNCEAFPCLPHPRGLEGKPGCSVLSGY